VKIVVFGPQQRVGALAGEQIIDLNRAYARANSPSAADERVPARLDAFIAGGQAVLDAAQQAMDHASSTGPDGQVMFRAGEVNIHAPWPMRRIACAGGNYGEHLRGMESGGEASVEEVVRKARERGQWGFWKVPAVVAGPDDEVPFPRHCTYFDYEGEAAIVLGKQGKDIPAGRLHEYVWGITLLNDWSIRDGGMGHPFPMSYNLAKNFDMSTSMGPCIVVGELQPEDVNVELRVNGQVRQKYNTRGMVFSFGEILEFLSRDFTFVPGDVISGGTNVGTAADQTKRGPDGRKPLDLFLKIGDTVELSSPSVGVVRNRIV